MVITLIIIFGGIFGYDALRTWGTKQYLEHFKAPPVTISSATVKSTTWHNSITAVGTIYSYQSVDISPQQAGQIEKIYFKSGDIVQKNQPLIGQDTSLDEQSLKSDEAKLVLAKANFQRDKKLAKQNFVSQSMLDQKRAALSQAIAEVARTKEIIAEKTIRAPFAGKIGIREVNLGQYVSPGDKLTSLQSLNPLRAIFSIPEQNLPEVKRGLPVKVSVDAYPGKTFPGVITAIDSQINQDTRNFQIEARLPNDKLELYPGMFANISIELPSTQNALVIPQTAITYNLYGDSVYVLTPEKGTTTKDDKSKSNKTVYLATTKYITVGEQRDNEAIVTKGLKAGDVVVTSGQLKVHDGTRVTVNNSINPNQAPTTINAME